LSPPPNPIENAHKPISVRSLKSAFAPRLASTVNAIRVESPEAAAIDPETSSTTSVRNGSASTDQSRSVLSIANGFFNSSDAADPTPRPSASGTALDGQKPASDRLSAAATVERTDASAAPASLAVP
jgi:hypothetical protein